MRKRKQPLGTRTFAENAYNSRKQIGRTKGSSTQLQIRGVDINTSGLSKLEGQVRSVLDKELIVLSEVLDVSVLWLLGLE